MDRSVLFVDDDTNLLRAYERRFHMRFKVFSCPSAITGLAACREIGPFAVVVSDRQMPVMDGVEFLTRVHETYPMTVCILLTGWSPLISAVGADVKPLYRILSKPCPLNLLAAAIEDGFVEYRRHLKQAGNEPPLVA